MRQVALLVTVLFALAAMPAVPAASDCRSPCQTVVVPTTALGASRTYYVYAQGALCQPSDLACKADASVAPLLYQETNCQGGLQRFGGFECGPDTLVVL